MTAPRFQSKFVPGLVMWPNGAIVRVRVDEDGAIVRDRNGRVDVRESHARILAESPLDREVFDLVETRAIEARHEAQVRAGSALAKLLLLRAQARAASSSAL